MSDEEHYQLQPPSPRADAPRSPDDIVIAGIGTVSAIGWDSETAWKQILRNRNGISEISVKGLDFPLRVGMVRQPPLEYDPLRVDRTAILGKIACREAIQQAFGESRIGKSSDSQVSISNSTQPSLPGHENAACVASVSKGGVALDTALRDAERTGNLKGVNRYSAWLNGFPASRFAETLCREFDLRGIRRSPIAACATGPLLLHTASNLLQTDPQIPWVLVASAESSLVPLFLHAFRKMNVMADPGEPLMRPFDAKRSGFQMGEGASAMILTDRRRAEKSGLRPLAVLSATAIGCDPTHLTAFHPQGEAVVRVARAALQNAGIAPDELGYINAHATATIRNDTMEAAALRKILGEAADDVPISGTKAATGHLLGGSGLLEAAWCVLALRDQLAPPTIGLDTIAPECEGIRIVQHQPEFLARRTAMSLNYGFGGHIGVIVIRNP